MTFSDIFTLLRALDSELYHIIDELGFYTYLLLFLIVFGKTGLVVLTFLPGDSLLFASGTIAAMDQLNIFVLFGIFFVATSLADSSNYLIGRTFSKIPPEKSFLFKFIPQSTIDKAQEFFDDYGKIAITFSRFIPLMRTMIPFTVGYTKHPYHFFIRYNITGALIWTFVWLGAGFLLGNITWVENNLLFTITIITILLFVPSIYGFFSQFRKKHAAVHITKRS